MDKQDFLDLMTGYCNEKIETTLKSLYDTVNLIYKDKEIVKFNTCGSYSAFESAKVGSMIKVQDIRDNYILTICFAMVNKKDEIGIIDYEAHTKIYIVRVEDRANKRILAVNHDYCHDTPY